MTGYDLLDLTLGRLNYTDELGNGTMTQNTELTRRAMGSINYILADLRRIMGLPPERIGNLAEEIPMDEDVCERVMPWGVGMMLAQSESDGDNQQYFAVNYNGLRNSVPKPSERVGNVIPHPRYILD